MVIPLRLGDASVGKGVRRACQACQPASAGLGLSDREFIHGAAYRRAATHVAARSSPPIEIGVWYDETG